MKLARGRWTVPFAVAVTALGAGAMALSAVCYTSIRCRMPLPSGAALALCAGLAAAVCSLLVGVAGARRSAGGALSVCLGAGPLFATVPCLAPVVLFLLVDPGLSSAGSGGLLGALLALALGAAAAGLLAGVVVLPPALVLASRRREGSHEDLDRAMGVCGAWLAAVGVLCYVIVFQAGATSGHDVLNPQNAHWKEDGAALAFACAAVAALGVMISAVGWGGLSWRRAWFSRVLLGEADGWAILPASQVSAVRPGLRPLFSSGETGEVLVRFRDDLQHGAYRSGRRAVPYALV